MDWNEESQGFNEESNGFNSGISWKASFFLDKKKASKASFFRQREYITTPSIWKYEGTDVVQQLENALECIPRKSSHQATGSSSIAPPLQNTQIYIWDFSSFSYYLYVTLVISEIFFWGVN